MEQTEDFNTDAFFNDGSLPQIDPTSDLGTLHTVSLPAQPAVVEQVTRRWSSGCLERLSWSRHGHLASISDDGSSVFLECLRFKQDSRSWGLSGKYALNVVFEEAISLAWSGSGAELAVGDVHGRIFIFHVSPAALNRLILARQPALEDGDELGGQPVGMTWLGQDRHDRPRNVVSNATKTDTKWTLNHARAKPLGPHWPRAVVMVHRKGNLTLCYLRGDGQYSRITKELSTNADLLFTHAAFSPTVENKLLVILHSYSATLSVYLVQIDWTEVRQSLEGLPNLTVEVVAHGISSLPTHSPINGDVYDPDSWSLTHLEVIPTSDVEKAVQLPPTIVAVLTGVNRSVSVADSGHLVSTLIRRWTVKAVEQKLHPRFDDLPSKPVHPVESTSVSIVQRQMDREEQQVITSTHLIDAGQTIVITTQDGRTEFLSSDDLSPLSYRAAPDEVSSMTQSGFAFPPTATILWPSFSPNACVRADMGPDGQLQFTNMEYQQSHHGQTQRSLDPNLDAAIASLDLTFARACWSSSTIDDIVSCVLHTMSDEHVSHAIAAMYHTLFRDTEFANERAQGSEIERVLSKHVLSKVMSFHAGLSCTSPSLAGTKVISSVQSHGWTLSGQWAWLANNLRHTATLLYMSLRYIQTPNAVNSPDFIDMLCQHISWGLSVIRYIVSTIFDVGDRQTNPAFFPDLPAGARLGDYEGDGSQGLVALLLNVHWSRIFLFAITRAVGTYAKLPEPKTRHQAQLLRTILQHTDEKGLNFQAIESMLDCRWAGAGDVEGNIGATAARQIEMMATGNVPESYQGTVKRLLTKLFNVNGGLRERTFVDRLKLLAHPVDEEYLFLNTNVRGKGDDGTTRKIYDIHRRRLILKGARENHGTGEEMIRRCVRCGSYSEDVNGPSREWPRQVAALLSKCVCDGFWILEPWDPNVV